MGKCDSHYLGGSCYFLMCLAFGIGFVVFFSMNYSHERWRERYYRPSLCTVERITSCFKDICSYNLDNVDYIYTCYYFQWYVHFHIENNHTEIKYAYVNDSRRFDSCEKAFQTALIQHPLNSSDVCHYNSINNQEVQWEKPNSTSSLIGIIIGALIILTVLLCAICVFIENCLSSC
ncbi:hypothetical protein I4U23_027475 [Adineta vaga]|nr:hypothetical protein I4U23_027475 [Adineta vaga]